VKNLITDVPGLKVGHATDTALGSGVTALVFDEPAVASVDLRGGGPGTRETDLLQPAATVERIDAIALSGGSAFGLDAAAGVMALLAEQGRGFAVGSCPRADRAGRDPVRPARPRRQEMGTLSALSRTWLCSRKVGGPTFELGSVGAGTGATTENLKGGLGSASAEAASGHMVGALAAVNAVGRVTVGDGPHFWAAPFERGKRIRRPRTALAAARSAQPAQ
jgi:L-aminopeptidase/D-esterase-like protein